MNNFFYFLNTQRVIVNDLEGTRLEVNTEIPGTPVVAGGFHSVGTVPISSTFGFYLGIGKSASVKGILLKQPFQTNFGITNVIGR